MSQIQGMMPEPHHRHSGQGANPASSLLPTDGGAVGDGQTGDNPRTLADGTVAWPPDWDEKKKADWRRRNGLAPPSEPGAGP
jgi:hypothetical protein